MYLKLLFLLVSCGIVAACGKPKEAADPSSLVGDDEVGGVENTGAPSPKPDATAARADTAPEPAATREDCAQATRHLEELGLDLAIGSEKDDKQRARLQAHKADALDDPQVKARMVKGTQGCLDRHTSKKEALCIAQVRAEEDIDRCVGGGDGS